MLNIHGEMQPNNVEVFIHNVIILLIPNQCHKPQANQLLRIATGFCLLLRQTTSRPTSIQPVIFFFTS